MEISFSMSDTVIPAAFFESSGVDAVSVVFCLESFFLLVRFFFASYCYDIIGMLKINLMLNIVIRGGAYMLLLGRTQMVDTCSYEDSIRRLMKCGFDGAEVGVFDRGFHVRDEFFSDGFGRRMRDDYGIMRG